MDEVSLVRMLVLVGLLRFYMGCVLVCLLRVSLLFMLWLRWIVSCGRCRSVLVFVSMMWLLVRVSCLVRCSLWLS